MTALLTERAPSPARVHFGHRLRHWRRSAGLTQAELGRRMAYDHSFISRVERGSRWPTRELALRCDEFLGADGELVELWRTADRERQAAQRPSIDAIVEAIAARATGPLPVDPMLIRQALATQAIDPLAPEPEPDGEPVPIPTGEEDDPDGHLRQVVRWLEHAPGPVLRRLAGLVAGRTPAS